MRFQGDTHAFWALKPVDFTDGHFWCVVLMGGVADLRCGMPSGAGQRARVTAGGHTKRRVAARSRKMPTTAVRRRTSLFSRSSGLLDQSSANGKLGRW